MLTTTTIRETNGRYDTEPHGGDENQAPLPEHFADLVDHLTGPIGRVVGSEKEPAGAHAFCIWAADEARSLDVGHVVVAFSEEAAVIGVVDEPRRFSDLGSFLDDYFDRHGEQALDADLATLRPEILVFTVNVLATKHLRDDVDSHRPPVGGPVWFATPAAIEFALGREQFSGAAIPALMHTNGNAERDDAGQEKRDERGHVVFQRAPIWLDGDYLLGPEAGHANWTGQSGLATKTSHALFLTSAVFQRMRAEKQKVAALLFNVKGPDLLWLDKPAHPEEGMEEAYNAVGRWSGLRPQDFAAYAALGLEPKPFERFRIFAPFKPGQAPEAKGSQAVYLDQGRHAAALNTLRTLPRETEGVVFPVLWPLEPLLWMPHKVFDRGDLDDKLSGFVYELRQRGIESIAQLESLFAEIEDHFAADDAPSDWRGHHKFTIQKARNRFQHLPEKFGGLLSRSLVEYGTLPRVDDEFGDQELRVVDIAGCNSDVQELLVTSVITKLWRRAEQEKLGVDKVIVFVDELNKYAPGGGQGGLRDTLVDIAARGRHLNVVLFGAQQFRSKVDDEILGNCGTSLYGRVGDEEITNAAYRSLSETVKAELLGLPKGRLLVRHAHFRAPLFGAFPLPPTIPGMAGQRVFNAEEGVARAGAHDGDGLFKMLQRTMGDRAPRKHQVRELTAGLDPRDLDQLCHQIERAVHMSNGNGARRPDPWYMVQREIGKLRTRAR
ncbi:MAG: hypothetical protein M3Q10_05500 [Chloroflexota bacterium]|nr:hypothetical protein [Chloroflexota bacterium]